MFENEMEFCIDNIPQFKTCLDSVKFPTSHTSRFNDVILQAHQKGIVLKSASHSGNIMTRCMIRKEFFVENSYQIHLKNLDDIQAAENKEADCDSKTLIEFCLPFSQIKHLVDGMAEKDNEMYFEYPHGDNMLQLRIPEESKGSGDKLSMMTSLQLETYEAKHSLDADYSFKSVGIAAQFFAKVSHFKKALKEFSWLKNDANIAIKVSETSPKLSFVFQHPQNNRYHAVKFNDNMEGFVIQHISEQQVLFRIESLRLAFTRITSDQLLCIVTLNNEGALSVRLMYEDKAFMTESLILCQEEGDSEASQ